MTEIRKATEEDLPSILIIYRNARTFMKERGNPDQWGESYPDKDTVENDITHNQLFLVTEDNTILAVFVCTTVSEPAYENTDCSWHSEKPYAVVHRVASSGNRGGITKLIFDYAREKTGYIRIDTHRANVPMQNALKNYGFLPTGTVYYSRDGLITSRIAFDFVEKSN
jgi:hypothetical protein